MRRSVAVAIALVAVLTASALVAVPGAVSAAPSQPSAPHPAATDSIGTRSYYGGFQTSFDTGLSSGDVYWYATDPSDTTATVSINDLNATRDGLTNPVATTTAHFTGGVNASYASNSYLAIPLTLVYPGTWNITIQGTTAGFSYQNFTVSTYYVETFANVSPAIVLPGHSISLDYNLISTVNDATLYTHASSVTVTGEYYTTSSTYWKIPGTPTSLGSASNGTYSLQMPNNASANGLAFLTFWANTSGSSNWSEQQSMDVYIGELSAPVVHLSACAYDCFTTSFTSGEPIVVTVGEMITNPVYSVSAAAPGIDLNIFYENGSKTITPVGSPPEKLTTDDNGRAQWIFTADTSPGHFTTTGTNTLAIHPSDPVTTFQGPWTNTTFTISKVSNVAPPIQITWGAAQYYGGDTMFSNWTVGGNATTADGWNATYYYVYDYSNGVPGETLIAQGALHGTSGTLSFPAPLTLNGWVYEYVYIANQTTYTYAYSGTVSVTPPQLLLSANEYYYNPGDTVTVTVATLGSILSSATLQALVTDNSGHRLITGAVSGDSMSVTIPTTAPPEYVEFAVFAIGTNGAVITNSTNYVYLASGYDIALGISTKSSYTDDSYQPGQTIQITYSISAHGYYEMPKAWTLYVWTAQAWFGGGTGLGTTELQSMGSSGTISYTIPSGTSNGITMLWIEAIPSSNAREASNGVALNVQSNPSGLNLELGAGSGLTVGWLILLIVIVVIAIVLFLAIRGRGRPKMMKPEGGSPPSGGAPPQTWQEQPSSSSPSTDTPPATPPSGGGS